MPTIYAPARGNWRITMYFGDHNPPHFHVVCPDGEVLVEIETLTVIAGTIRANVLRPATTWAGANKEALTAKWVELHE